MFFTWIKMPTYFFLFYLHFIRLFTYCYWSIYLCAYLWLPPFGGCVRVYRIKEVHQSVWKTAETNITYFAFVAVVRLCFDHNGIEMAIRTEFKLAVSQILALIYQSVPANLLTIIATIPNWWCKQQLCSPFFFLSAQLYVFTSLKRIDGD